MTGGPFAITAEGGTSETEANHYHTATATAAAGGKRHVKKQPPTPDLPGRAYRLSLLRIYKIFRNSFWKNTWT